MSPEAKNVGDYLEGLVRKRGINAVLTYTQLARHFGMPELTDAWLSHPLSKIFDELDDEDHAKARPFRTVLVYAEGLSTPGDGFFEMLRRLRFPEKTTLFRSDTEKLKIYNSELQALASHYQGR